jgi:hypothetical protein
MDIAATLVKTERGIAHTTCALGLSWETVNDLNRSSELLARRGASGRETAKRLEMLAGTISALLLKS